MEPTVITALALAFLGFGAISARAERSMLTPPMFFVAVGLVLSQTGLVDASATSPPIELLGELALLLVLFTDASRIDLSALRREQSVPARLLAIGLPLTILAGAWVGGIILGLGFWEALIVGAILAPTDAALGQAVVSSPVVPVRIRQSLNVESGLNDGIALPVVLLAATFAGATEGSQETVYWIRFAALQLGLAPLVGIAVALVGGRLISRASRAGWMTESFQDLSALSLAITAYAGAELVGGNGFISAFVAGLTLGNTSRDICTCLYEFGEAEGQLLTLLVFAMFGAILAPQALAHLAPRHVLYAIASLTIVRMVPVALALCRTGLRPASLAFIGWFGPRGLASILYMLIIIEEARLPSSSDMEAVIVFTVLLSMLAHGMSAFPLSQAYGRWVARQEGEEHVGVPEMPVRITPALHEPAQSEAGPT